MLLVGSEDGISVGKSEGILDGVSVVGMSVGATGATYTGYP